MVWVVGFGVYSDEPHMARSASWRKLAPYTLVHGFGFRVSDFGYGFWLLDFGFGVWSLGFGVWGLGFGV